MDRQRPFSENTFRRVAFWKECEDQRFRLRDPFATLLSDAARMMFKKELPGGSRGRGHACTYG